MWCYKCTYPLQINIGICMEQNRIQEISKLDLNTMVYFVAVMNYRTVMNASNVMNCSSPTVSVMLKRFCSYFPVPLFEREGRTLSPTRYAYELHKRIEKALCDIQETISDEKSNNKEDCEIYAYTDHS